MQKKKQVKAKGPKPEYTRKEVAGPRIIASQYVASAVRPDQYPEGDTVEVAFLGRSNVGKSSLINSLCNHRGLALVSGTPGKTRTINFFAIESKEDINEDQERRYHWYLVDLPGYGYAKTDRKAKSLWSGFISDYILNSDRLMLLCLLIDSRHPDLPIDQEAFNWLKEAGVPLQIVMTKMDKLNSSERQKSLSAIAAQFPTDRPPIPYSSLKHMGRDKLQACINEIIKGDGH